MPLVPTHTLVCHSVGKMLIYGAMLGCLDPVATIAAAMSSRTPFVSPLDKRAAADEAKASFGLK